MGKRKRNFSEGSDSQHSPSTVFVANLPFSFSNSEMEGLFSEVGPIRRCFLVTKKGTTEHRGFGYVQFASVEDATRAIEQKNNSTVGGRKIIVKPATHRAPLEHRRAKADNGQSEDVLTNTEKPKSTNAIDEVNKAPVPRPKDTRKEKIKKTDVSSATLNQQKVPDKQRVAKTVIIGGILNDGMAEEVHRQARELGETCSISYPLPEAELEHHGLAADGCKPTASSILYTSVKSARQCVAALHQKEIHGGLVWARQLGGEGAKTQKWKLILRNLPFQVNKAGIRDMFSSAGFVWDVVITQNLETGLSKGYAFVKFTSRNDAEKAIQSFNGKKYGKRQIAVDWAVPKNVYVTSSNATSAEYGQEEVDAASSESEDIEMGSVKESQGVDGSYDSMDESDSVDEDHDTTQIDLLKEQEISKRVLENFILPTSKDGNEKDGSAVSVVKVNNDSTSTKNKSSDASGKQQLGAIDTGTSQSNAKSSQDEDELRRTVFLNNLPFDVTADEVKDRFSSFGEVQSFLPVLHKVTKRPRGSGFLKFTTPDAANAAFSAANVGGSSGILFKGRSIKVLKALDKNAAHNKSLEKGKRRKLTIEGFILEGTPAAEGVSVSDMSKRKKLYEDKMTKLRSPNFRVSNTRLIVYNVPKTMDEADLKSLFINAVTSRATKQKPTIRQIKIMKDSKKGKEGHKRDVAFLEFSEHQHALVALRVLNNNPDTFDAERRPIVEFALDNVQKLKIRSEKLQRQQQHRDSEFPSHKRSEPAREHDKGTEDEKRLHPRKHKPSQMPGTRKTSPEMNSPSTPKTRSLKKKEKLAPRRGKLNGSDENGVAKTAVKQVTESDGSRNRKRTKTKEPDPKRGKPNASDENGVAKTAVQFPQKNQRKQVTESDGSRKRKRTKTKEAIGRDVVDKLDMLIEQYREKFSGGSSNSAQKQQGIKQLKRWFES